MKCSQAMGGARRRAASRGEGMKGRLRRRPSAAPPQVGARSGRRAGGCGWWGGGNPGGGVGGAHAVACRGVAWARIQSMALRIVVQHSAAAVPWTPRRLDCLFDRVPGDVSPGDEPGHLARAAVQRAVPAVRPALGRCLDDRAFALQGGFGGPCAVPHGRDGGRGGGLRRVQQERREPSGERGDGGRLDDLVGAIRGGAAGGDDVAAPAAGVDVLPQAVHAGLQPDPGGGGEVQMLSSAGGPHLVGGRNRLAGRARRALPKKWRRQALLSALPPSAGRGRRPAGKPVPSRCRRCRGGGPMRRGSGRARWWRAVPGCGVRSRSARCGGRSVRGARRHAWCAGAGG